MEPVSLELVNFGKHKKYTLDYKPGITGVIGENGHGKSTLVDPAQYFAITGQTPNRFKKESFLHWRADTGKTIFIFKHDGVGYKLTRNLHNTQTFLEWGSGKGKRIIRTLSEVNLKMSSILGMSFDIFRETCFAPQGSFCDIVNMRHSERTVYFQKVTGLRYAEELRELLQQKINEIPVFPYLEKDLKRVSAELNTAAEEYRRISLRLRRLKIRKKEVDTEFKNATKILGMSSKSEQERQKTDILHKLVDIRRKNDNALSQRGSDIDSNVGMITPGERKNAYKYSNYLSILSKLQTFNSEHRTSSEIRIDLENFILAKGKLILKKELISGEKCPTCGQKIVLDFPETELEQRIEDINTKLKDIKKELKQTEVIEALEEQLKENECVEVDLKAFAEREKAYTEYVKKQEELKKINAELHKYEIEKAKAETELSILESVPTVEDYEKKLAEKILIDCEEYVNRLNILISDKAAAKATLDERQRLFGELRSSQVKAAAYSKLKNRFETAREALHRDNLPKFVMSRIIYCLNESMEFYLSKFNTNFSAYLAEDFDFRCDFLDSGDANKPAFTSLSGGQKVALSLAFRFALADVLGASVPILVLDEPTIHLDSTNIEAMCEVFKEVRSFAENNMHIFISTHEDILQKAFTRTLVV